MDKTYSLIISIYEGLKLDVVLCADKYGFVHGKEHDMPYHNKMDNFIRKVKSLDNSDGRYDDFLSSDAIYKRIE